MTEVRYFAAVRAAAGVDADRVEATTLAEALDAVRALHDARFAQVLGSCSFVVDGAPAGTRDPATVPVGAVVEALPPFAGG